MLPGNFPQKVKMIMQFNSCNFSDCFNVFFNVVPSVGIFFDHLLWSIFQSVLHIDVMVISFSSLGVPKTGFKDWKVECKALKPRSYNM